MRMKSVRHVLILSLALSPTTYAAICPATGHEYQVVSGLNITWTNARSAAQALTGGGWDLASIGSAEENTCVINLLPGATERDHYWIGGTDAATEGTWVWVDGTAWAYTNWWAGAPDDPTSREDYLAYDYRSGAWAWNDAPNDLAGEGFRDYAKGYVAERIPPTAPPAPTTVAAPVPTLSQWAMIALSGLLAFGAIFALRGRRG